MDNQIYLFKYAIHHPIAKAPSIARSYKDTISIYSKSTLTPSKKHSVNLLTPYIKVEVSPKSKNIEKEGSFDCTRKTQYNWAENNAGLQLPIHLTETNINTLDTKNMEYKFPSLHINSYRESQISSKQSSPTIRNRVLIPNQKKRENKFRITKIGLVTKETRNPQCRRINTLTPSDSTLIFQKRSYKSVNKLMEDEICYKKPVFENKYMENNFTIIRRTNKTNNSRQVSQIPSLTDSNQVINKVAGNTLSPKLENQIKATGYKDFVLKKISSIGRHLKLMAKRRHAMHINQYTPESASSCIKALIRNHTIKKHSRISSVIFCKSLV